VDAGKRRAIALEAATLVVALTETIAGLVFGLLTGSPVITGLGLESLVKVAAVVVAGWEVISPRDRRREAQALRVLAFGFFAVAALIAADALLQLVDRHHPQVSPAGLVAAVVGAVVLLPLAEAKRRLARRTGSLVVRSSAAKTRLYGYLAIASITGVVLEEALGLWWADPLAALAVSALAVREGAYDWLEATVLLRPAAR
jgi:divalent metal cation (Fe/Co/Zn/Cd) transporter